MKTVGQCVSGKYFIVIQEQETTAEFFGIELGGEHGEQDRFEYVFTLSHCIAKECGSVPVHYSVSVTVTKKVP